MVTLGLFTRWGCPRAVTGSLQAGLAAWVLGAYVLAWDTPYLALAAALGGYVAGAGVEVKTLA